MAFQRILCLLTALLIAAAPLTAQSEPCDFVAIEPNAGARILPDDNLTRDRFYVPRDLGTIIVPVYFHDIYIQGISGNIGYISDEILQNWISALNANFSEAGFQFDVRGIEHIEDDDWYYAHKGSDNELAMKSALRVGGAETLNIYMHNGNRGSSYAAAPNQYENDPILDGVVLVNPNAVVLTHEIGHWLGLLHTFHNGCSTEGDGVRDTPAHRRSNNIPCDQILDTCPTYEGQDPNNNFMNYQFHCANEFTPGQNSRMCDQWLTYRANVVYETTVDARRDCNGYTNTTFLPAGRYKLIPTDGAFNWGGNSRCGWDWLVRVRVQANGQETVLRAERNLATCATSFGEFYSDTGLVMMDMNDQVLDFTVPAGGSDVAFLMRDSNCNDNQGDVSFQIVSQ